MIISRVLAKQNPVRHPIVKVNSLVCILQVTKERIRPEIIPPPMIAQP
jgi:hypothetical protein